MARSTADAIDTLRSDLARIESSLSAQIAELRALVESEAARCPHREAIARACDNHARLQRLEDEVRAMRLESARAGATGGGMVAVVCGVVIGIGRALGWW